MKIYSYRELKSMPIENIMGLIPQNIADDKNDQHGNFHMGKIIDGSFYFEYRSYNVNRNFEKTIYSSWYEKDFKEGLIKCFLWAQKQQIIYNSLD